MLKWLNELDYGGPIEHLKEPNLLQSTLFIFFRQVGQVYLFDGDFFIDLFVAIDGNYASSAFSNLAYFLVFGDALQPKA